MDLDHATCHRIISARDARYDGRFFTCVKTTGIYCRPVCPARTPAPANCDFLPSAAAAEEAGYRACLRCRPESSPDLGAWRGTSSTVTRGLRLIEAGALDTGSVADLADRLGVGERHLRRLFRQHLGATPIAVAQTRRVLLAKQLIHETALPMTEVALASGFGSLRRFNETFTALYGRAPGTLRRGKGADSEGNGLTLALSYEPPFAWEEMLDFLALRTITGVEGVEDGAYARVLRLGEQTGTVRIRHSEERHALKVDVDLPDITALPGVIARVRRVFDLGCDPAAITGVLGEDPVLGPMVGRRPGLRLPGAWDGLEIGVRAILGQQVSVKAATTIACRLVERTGKRISTTGPLTHAFPTAAELAGADLSNLGVPQKRADAVTALARLATEAPELFDGSADGDDVVTALTALPGIGPWTANYVAMRATKATDAFIEGDLVVRKSYSGGDDMTSAKDLAVLSNAWRPWRAYAVMHLWAAANDERTT